LKNYVKTIAENLEQGVPIVIYTVGGDTFSVLRQLRHRFGVLPTAICDADPAKQGRAYKGLFGIPVLSPDDAIAKYPNALFFISSMDYRYQIMGQLTDSGKLPADRIINWEPVVRRKSCIFFEMYICIHELGKLSLCWRENSPFVEWTGDYTEAAKNFLTLRHQTINDCENGKLHTECENCFQVSEDWYPLKPSSWWVNYAGEGICNFKCAYCTSSTHTAKSIEGAPEYGQCLSALRETGMLSDFYSVVLSTSGEPLLHPQHKEYFQDFDGYGFIVHTNGSVFYEGLFTLMQDKMVRLVVSIDAGTRETFKKIKGADQFHKVCKTLKRYSEAAVGMVIPKFIIMPGINDNGTDVDGMIALTESLNSPYAIIACDQWGSFPLAESVVNTIRKLKSGLEKRDILCVPYIVCETHEYVTALKAAFKE
jgi:pyruvate-formate lyase-activating enzyme